ncbi:hypothetical protein FD754_003343 [Muntiacus muntjak]|uniref:Uncharacterized protein n=1 Tax=Muntiacus muntjak TaxID=9888 RepID=A0A5N3WDP6_MUNMU|nr:hypothetical protein FD754_003343 [Muntiacus muntjak]
MSCPTLSDVDYITPASPVMLSSHLILSFFSFFFFFFYYSKRVHFLFSFLTLCLCFQYFHNNLLLFNKESALDPVPDTFSAHGTTIGSTDVFLCFRQPHENFRSHSMNASKLAWAHTTCGFWSFPNLLGIKVNNSITRGSGQPGFVRGCIAEQPTTVC